MNPIIAIIVQTIGVYNCALDSYSEIDICFCIAILG
jgi:hypothetical protein